MATVLVVPDRPVDSEPTWLVVVDATEYSWLPFTASVDVAVTRPAATFWICRSLPAEPTDTTPTGDVPANPPNVVPPIVTADTPVAADVVALLPSATLLSIVALALAPRASELEPVAVADVRWPPLPWLRRWPHHRGRLRTGPTPTRCSRSPSHRCSWLVR